MALSNGVLSGLIQTELANVMSIEDAAQLEKAADAIAKAVVTHITTSAVVNGTAAVAGGSSSGSHPVTGTVA